MYLMSSYVCWYTCMHLNISCDGNHFLSLKLISQYFIWVVTRDDKFFERCLNFKSDNVLLDSLYQMRVFGAIFWTWHEAFMFRQRGSGNLEFWSFFDFIFLKLLVQYSYLAVKDWIQNYGFYFPNWGLKSNDHFIGDWVDGCVASLFLNIIVHDFFG